MWSFWSKRARKELLFAHGRRPTPNDYRARCAC
jgi:hypothetical protein